VKTTLTKNQIDWSLKEMKKYGNIVLILILIMVLSLTGCGGSSGGGGNNPPGGDGNNPPGGGETPPVFFSIAESLVPITTSCPAGTVNYPYYIAKYEVPYVLWKEVYDWGQSNGYTINPGKPGGGYQGLSEVFFDVGHESDPVTHITWYDAVVWCNALTEYYNTKTGNALDCVYKDATGNIIKSSSDDTIRSYLNGLNVTNFNSSAANGYRMPTSVEWEKAARYKDGYDWTPGNYASGATAAYTDETATKEAAWYNKNSMVSDIFSTHPVGQKPVNGNALGLYDMSGNVWEWCFDIYIGTMRVCRGGGWNDSAEYLQVGAAYGVEPDWSTYFYSFRVVRTQ
jgi:sulfatase modifying factor 1